MKTQGLARAITKITELRDSAVVETFSGGVLPELQRQYTAFEQNGKRIAYEIALIVLKGLHADAAKGATDGATE
jgi:hypothetical protein